jgi:hypothetical protein
MSKPPVDDALLGARVHDARNLLHPGGECVNHWHLPFFVMTRTWNCWFRSTIMAVKSAEAGQALPSLSDDMDVFLHIPGLR